MSEAQHELVDQLRDILGLSVTEAELQRLLAQAYGSVQRAVDIYFTSGVEEVVDLSAQATAGPSTAATQVEPAPVRSARRARTIQTSDSRTRPTATSDFVELSSSTDNDYDPGKTRPGCCASQC